MTEATLTVNGRDWDQVIEACVESNAERIVVNMGPQHPSTHGVLRLILEIEGETIISARCGIGYLHTGIEKNLEYRNWTQGVTFVTRMDYLSPFFNETAYYLGVEKLLGVTDDIPERANVIRVMMMELNRISSHLVALGPAPLDGELDEPSLGVIGGFGQMQQVDPDKPWKGGRWVLKSESGQRYPLTLSTMLFDSSGVKKDAARREHREAIESCVAGATAREADPFAVACALDWLLYDWLMAHREDPDSAAIQIPKGHDSDAPVIVAAASASVCARAKIDPGLAAPIPTN